MKSVFLSAAVRHTARPGLFPVNLRFLRKQRGLNQEDISALFQKKGNTVGNWENGKTEPSISELMLIGEYFGVSLEDLMRTELKRLPARGPDPAQPELPFGADALPLPAALPVFRDSVAGASQPGNSSGFPPGRTRPPAIASGDPGTPTPASTTHIYMTAANSGQSPEDSQDRTGDGQPLEEASVWFILRELRNVHESLALLQAQVAAGRSAGGDKSDH